VLLRYLAADDPQQARLAKALVEEAKLQGERLYVSTVALCELVWVLRSAPYSLGREAMASMLQHLLATPLFEIQSRDLVRRAVGDYQSGKADFADYLLGWLNREAGCRDTATFDRKLRKTAGFAFLL
jgi:predicted nucleic-acid-binding protein